MSEDGGTPPHLTPQVRGVDWRGLQFFVLSSDIVSHADFDRGFGWVANRCGWVEVGRSEVGRWRMSGGVVG